MPRWIPAERTSRFTVGLDLGQVADFTALVIVERITEPLDEWTSDFHQKTRTRFHVRHLERPPLSTSYLAIADRVRTILTDELVAKEDTSLVVDATGVGRPVVDLLEAANLNPIAVTITGGDEENSAGYGYRVPKRNLVSTLQIAFQSGTLKIAQTLPLADVLVKELLNFKVKITANAHDTYEAWREGVHDDLVLATALAVWWAERQERYKVGLIEIAGV